jgi:hypothetical protein
LKPNIPSKTFYQQDGSSISDAEDKMPLYSEAKANILWIDAILLVGMWLLVVITSIRSIGYIGPALFVLLSFILILRNTTNGILVLLLIFYSPAIAVGLPYIFAVTAGLVASKLAFFDIPSGRRQLRFNRIIYAAMAFVFFAGVMTIFAPNMDMALNYFSKYIEGLILLIIFNLAVPSRNVLGRVFVWWAVFAGLASVIKLVHIELGENTALYEMMKVMHSQGNYNIFDRTHIMVSGDFARRFLLPGEEPNYTSANLVFPFAIAIGLYDTKEGFKRLIWIIIACLVAAGIVGTYSRSGFIALCIVTFVYLFRGNMLKAIFLPALLVCIAAIAALIIPQLHDRIFGIDSAIKGGATGRFTMWQLALKMWLQSPIYGNGMSAFYAKYREAVHSSYLQVLCETGIIGLILYLSVTFQAFFLGLQLPGSNQRKTTDVDTRFGRILFAGLIGASAIIGTITYQDVKMYWLVCGTFATLFITVGCDSLAAVESTSDHPTQDDSRGSFQ